MFMVSRVVYLNCLIVYFICLFGVYFGFAFDFVVWCLVMFGCLFYLLVV